jgi:hypothetical protein
MESDSIGGSFDPVKATEIYIEEHKTRLKYQGLVYLVCAELDHLLGRSVALGTGTPATEDDLLRSLRMLRPPLKSYTDTAMKKGPWNRFDLGCPPEPHR